jgi:autotransporter passenger strand-loop-strand repeat protein
MTTSTVSAGNSASFLVVSGGESLIVDGTTISTTVNSGGYENVSSGGRTSFTTVSSGGYQNVFTSGITTGTILLNSGTETVFNGGSAISTTVGNRGYEYVSSGGTAIGTTLSNGTEFVWAGGKASFTTVSLGGGLAVYSGGSDVSATVSGGGTEFVESGGTTTGTLVTGTNRSSYGYQEVYSGGVTTGTTVAGIGAQEYVYFGGTASGTVVSDRGFETVLSGGRAIGTTDDSFLEVSGGSAVSATVGGDVDVYSGGSTISTTLSGGTEFVWAGGTASFTTMSAGGDLAVESGGSAIGATATGLTEEIFVYSGGTASGAVLGSGGTELLEGGTAIGTTVNSGGYEYVSAGGTATSTTVSLGGMIDVAYLPYASGGTASVNGSDLLTVSVGSQTYTQQLAGSYAGETFVLASNGAGPGTLVTAACYRAGTRIRTERGEVPIEQLRAGDRVAAAFGGMVEVVWLGYRRVDCRHQPKPGDVWPVRVAAGAFGEGLPAHDLWLSPDHAVYVDGVLIPIRHLVNGATITQDAVDEVMYWHVELPVHDVIFADGLPAESYLDTGNRGAFANGDGPVMLNPDFARHVWATEACAKLVLDGPKLAAVRRRLRERAEALGFATSDDPELKLRIGEAQMPPRLIAGGMYRFAVPRGSKELCFVSRSGIPAEINDVARDHRRLGVMVERIVLRRPGWRQEIALDSTAFGDGFYPVEHDDQGVARRDDQEVARTWRWTDGSARLVLPANVARDGKLVVDLHIVAVQESWVRGECTRQANRPRRPGKPSVRAA